MSLSRPSEVRAILRELDFKPSKVLGQNFLIDGNILGIMVESAEVIDGDAVLEIGPGLGVLTEALLEAGACVKAIEKDDRLFAFLSERFANRERLTLIHGDVMRADLRALCGEGSSKVVANLPYSVGTRALVDLAELPDGPRQMVVTVQLDVGERLAAQSNTKAYGSVSVMLQTLYEVSLRKVVTPSCFYPAPKVKSAIMNLRRLEDTSLAPRDRKHFRALVKHAFQHRRKQLGTILQHLPAFVKAENEDARRVLADVGIDTQARPTTLSPSDWVALSNALTASHAPLEC